MVGRPWHKIQPMTRFAKFEKLRDENTDWKVENRHLSVDGSTIVMSCPPAERGLRYSFHRMAGLLFFPLFAPEEWRNSRIAWTAESPALATAPSR